MQSLDVCKKSSGKIWFRKPVPSSDNGLLIKINSNISPGRNIRFLHTTFNKHGDVFVTGDHQGHIYMFDLEKNRFMLVVKTGQPCTAVCFNNARKTEVLVALADYSLHCYDIESQTLISTMKGHTTAIHSLSIHASGKYALSTSSETALLWNLETLNLQKKLSNKEDVPLLKAFFLPISNTIITCFKDDSIFAWESETLTCKFQLSAPDCDVQQYKVFAAARDGRLLAAGGKSRFIHLWSLDTRRILRIIELPNKVTSIKQIEFLPDSFHTGINQVLGVLCQDGIIRYINVDTCKLLFDIGDVENKVYNSVVSPAGRHIVCSMETGSLHVYSVGALSSELNKPPAPLVKVVTNNKMCDTMSTCASDKSYNKTIGNSTVRSRPSSTLSHRQPTSQDTTQASLPDGMEMNKLLAILKGYGEYPAKYRMFIWRSVLRLPENHAAYAALVDKGTHPAFSKMHEVYPLKSRKLLRVLQRILSALAHWSPIFGETQYLPMLAFPFVKLFQNNHLVCFEIVATLLVNWGGHWFEYFPNPPINILAMIENLLAHHDNQLLQHFIKYGVTSQIYAWPLLESVFSEVLTKEEWLMLWDNVLSRHPSFLVMLVVAYAICARGPLMQCTELEDFKYFYHHRNAVDIKQVIKEASRLLDMTPDDIHPRKLLEKFKPLTKGQYPVFNKYPKYIVDYQVQERDRIRQEENEYLRQKQLSLNTEQEAAKRRQEEEAWYRQQQLLLEAENKRRLMIQCEEQKLADQRKRLFAMNREIKLKELQLLDAARRKFLQFQKTQRESELKRLDDEMQRKALLRDQETEGAIEEAEIRNLELQLKRKMFEQELFRDFAVTSQQLKSEQDAHHKQEELENRIRQRVQNAEHERQNEVRKMMEQNLAVSTQQNIDMWAHTEMEKRFRIKDLEREAKNVQLARLHTQNRTLENEVHSLMKKCHDEKEKDTDEGYKELGYDVDDHIQDNIRRLDRLELEAKASKHHTDHLINNIPDQQAGTSKQISFQQPLQESFLPEDTSMSSKVSFERSRETFDEKEIELLNEVRRLRHRLASENRHKKPPSAYPTDYRM